MSNRRKFLKSTVFSGLAMSTASFSTMACATEKPVKKPIVVSTWNHGMEANAEAWKVLEKGGRAVDAVEQGVRVTEADENNATVGIGGFPDRDGKVTLDACIMDENENCGSVAFLQDFKHPISVARKVMDDVDKYVRKHCGITEKTHEIIWTSCGTESNCMVLRSSVNAYKKALKRDDLETILLPS